MNNRECVLFLGSTLFNRSNDKIAYHSYSYIQNERPLPGLTTDVVKPFVFSFHRDVFLALRTPLSV